MKELVYKRFLGVKNCLQTFTLNTKKNTNGKLTVGIIDDLTVLDLSNIQEVQLYYKNNHRQSFSLHLTIDYSNNMIVIPLDIFHENDYLCEMILKDFENNKLTTNTFHIKIK